jgi:hemoglobin
LVAGPPRHAYHRGVAVLTTSPDGTVTDPTPTKNTPPANIYEALGAETLHGIARTFYGMVDVDPEPRFRSMFPPKLDEAIQNLAEFLIQYFGGPTDYDKRRGHPRLRGRHLEFHIDKWARDRWMSYMTKAVESANIPENYRKFILGYFDHTATFLMNQGGPPPGHDGNTP